MTSLLAELFKFLGNLSPGWAVSALILCIVAWRLPSIIREIFAGVREHAKVMAEIARKQEKANLEIAEKRERMQQAASKARTQRAISKAPKP